MSEKNCKLKQSENVKRFTFGTQQTSVGEIQVIIDNKEKQVYANCLSICELLKELSEENEQLKKRNEFLEEFDGQAKTVANLKAENEQLQQELRGMDKLLKSYRETIKHDAELLADATRNGYLPPLDDFVKG